MLLIVIVGVVGTIKFGQFKTLGESGAMFLPPPEAVNATVAEYQYWPNTFVEMGTVEAEQGINVVAEVPGKILKILVESGHYVRAGDILLEQESNNEEAQLRAAQARLRLAKTNYERVLALLKKNSVSKSEVDSALQQVDSVQGDVDDLKATLAKKVVRAPFAGHLGILQVDPGQVIQPGEVIVSLQAVDRVKVNFPMPQEWFPQVKPGMPVRLQRDNQQGQPMVGKVSALAAEISLTTRNAMVEAMVDNPDKTLIPGMAVEAQVELGKPSRVLAIPSTAIIYAPFGDTVFVVDKDENDQLVAKQQFVQLGRTRGDFTEVTSGLEEGAQVISTGAFKLFSGQSIVISDIDPPDFQLQPTPTDS